MSVKCMENTWSHDIETMCEKLRINCVNLSEYHRKRYYHFKSFGKYFRIPLIILASINSTASVGLQPLLAQPIISGVTCLIGMCMAIIGSIELYLNIHSSMDLELKQSKEFYTLAIDLYKILSIHRVNRNENGHAYLNKKYSLYIKLCEASNMLKRKLKIDTLAPIKNEFKDLSRTNTLIEDSESFISDIEMNGTTNSNSPVSKKPNLNILTNNNIDILKKKLIAHSNIIGASLKEINEGESESESESESDIDIDIDVDVNKDTDISLIN